MKFQCYLQKVLFILIYYLQIHSHYYQNTYPSATAKLSKMFFHAYPSTKSSIKYTYHSRDREETLPLFPSLFSRFPRNYTRDCSPTYIASRFNILNNRIKGSYRWAFELALPPGTANFVKAEVEVSTVSFVAIAPLFVQ